MQKINVPLLVVTLKDTYCNVMAKTGSSNPTWANVQRKILFKGYMHPNVHCNTVYNGQDMEAI